MNYYKLASISLLFLNSITWSATSYVVKIPSKAMNKSFKATVILPNSYKKGTKRYSVIYFLHGYSGDYSVWSKTAPLNTYADKYQLLFVCPDGGYNSWYLDSPKKVDSKFETYIVFEVSAWIDSRYRTFKSYKGRAIIGSSMGGHGAFTLLFKHPDMYACASSISGIMDLSEFPKNWDIAEVLGDYTKNRDLWHRNSALGLLDRFTNQKKALILDCGVNDFALNGNRKTHDKMIELGIPHNYHERPGGHSPQYVHNCVEYHILFFAKILQK